MIFDEEKIPHNLTNEQTIIVAACNDKEHWFLVSQSINEDDFYSAKHRKMFSVIKRLYDKKIDIDFEFLCQFLNDNNLAESVGGNDYLLFMLKNSICISSEHNLKIYIDAMRSSSIERKLLKAVNETREKILVKDGTTTNEILAKLEA
ncbi:MAG TPA: DnaB-like helicase N-terminal domain-containing protein, partial [Acinetobacter sp.]|nr:DnaB-like helicase N-terminal domain-containing protein [Acinetobacter sp.]